MAKPVRGERVNSLRLLLKIKTSCKRAKHVWRELWRVDEKQEAKSLGSNRTEEEMMWIILSHALAL